MPTLKFLFPGVQVELPPSSYVTTISGGKCEVYINTLSDTSTILLLGDTLFLNYVITFDKTQAQVGFYGSTTEIQIVGDNSGFMISQWIMISFTIIILILLCILNRRIVLNIT